MDPHSGNVPLTAYSCSPNVGAAPASGEKPTLTAADGTLLKDHGTVMNPMVGHGSGFGIVVTTLADETYFICCVSRRCSTFGFTARVPMAGIPLPVSKVADYLSRRGNKRTKLRVNSDGVTRLILGKYTDDKFVKIAAAVPLTNADANTCFASQLDYLVGMRHRDFIRKKRKVADSLRAGADPLSAVARMYTVKSLFGK